MIIDIVDGIVLYICAAIGMITIICLGCLFVIVLIGSIQAKKKELQRVRSTCPHCGAVNKGYHTHVTFSDSPALYCMKCGQKMIKNNTADRW